MKLFSWLQTAATIALAGLALASPSVARAAQSGKQIPSPPYYYVLDEPGVLSSQGLRALQTLLIEHDRLTGEQFLVAIFKSLDGEDLVDYTNRVFGAWKIGQRGKDNGVLLALYWNDHKARIEVGYGLEPLMTDAKSMQILSDILVPELQNQRPDRALSLSALEILKVLDSPLVHNGKAEQILRGGGFQGAFVPHAAVVGNVGLWPWFFLGVILLMIAMNFLHAAEAHFTRAGWYRPRPWEYYRVRRGNGGFWWGGGGGFGGGLGGGGGGFGGGGGGGFGGFSGGGGSSGGGGASGSW